MSLKLPDGLSTLNDELVQAGLTHGLYLQRYSNAEVRKLIGILNTEVIPELVARIQATYSGNMSYGSQRYQQMLAAVQGIVKAGYAQLGESVQGSAMDMAQYEAAFVTKSIQDRLPVEMELEPSQPSLEMLRQMTLMQPMDGNVLKDWVDNAGERLFAAIRQQLGIGIMAGESLDQLMARLKGNATTNGAFDGTRRGLETIVRSMVIHAANAAREATAKANSDIIKSMLWVATLDVHTCIVCAVLDGQTFPVGAAPMAPHLNCRCTLVPQVKSYKELGFNYNEVTGRTRASMDGKVAATMDFEEWLTQKIRNDPEFLDEFLGPKRAALYRSGKYSLENFINDKNQVLTLDQLAAQENP